jgi:hypothetical protein
VGVSEHRQKERARVRPHVHTVRDKGDRATRCSLELTRNWSYLWRRAEGRRMIRDDLIDRVHDCDILAVEIAWGG